MTTMPATQAPSFAQTMFDGVHTGANHLYRGLSKAATLAQSVALKAINLLGKAFEKVFTCAANKSKYLAGFTLLAGFSLGAYAIAKKVFNFKFECPFKTKTDGAPDAGESRSPTPDVESPA